MSACVCARARERISTYTYGCGGVCACVRGCARFRARAPVCIFCALCWTVALVVLVVGVVAVAVAVA